MKSLEMTSKSKLGIHLSVTSNPEPGKLALNMDIQAYVVEELDSL